MSSKIAKNRILLVDDHPIVRQGLAELINAESDLTVCGVADDGPEALKQIEKLQPDLVVVDVTLKSSNGLELLKDIRVRWPKMKVLMLSMHDEHLYALRALRAGACGFIMKHEATNKVVEGARHALQGDIVLSERMEKQMMRQMVGSRTPRTGSPLEDLSDRELQVFTMIGEGKGTRDIAEQLHLSIKTIESHRAHIKEKLNLKNGRELVQHAIQWREAEVPVSVRTSAGVGA